MKKSENLNQPQKKAVEHIEGPMLILAGAGSGKTRTITYRIAKMVKDRHVLPENILAITFTNKAAEEMRTRLSDLNIDKTSMWVCTFHSMCLKILKENIDKLGYEENFSIIDSDDIKMIYEKISNNMNLDCKYYTQSKLHTMISFYKNRGLALEEWFKLYAKEQEDNTYYRYASEYQKYLKEKNMMDFDDLLMLTKKLFNKYPETLSNYQEQFKYILVDEYQDTNHIQYEIIKLLAEKYRNICVCGDDDQSIYSWRGADISNILSFKDDYPDAFIVKLEQNYRSDKEILERANEVIKNNKNRMDKNMWTETSEFGNVFLNEYRSDVTEAKEIAKTIKELVKSKYDYSDIAILYRMNNLRQKLEEACIKENIPYKIIGGLNFYDRAEIKDILAYISVAVNPKNDLALKRIANKPKRGIGNKTLKLLEDFAESKHWSMTHSLFSNEFIESLDDKRKEKFLMLKKSILEVVSAVKKESYKSMIMAILENTGYCDYLSSLDDYHERLDNIKIFAEAYEEYEKSTEYPTVTGFMQEIKLITDVDDSSEKGKVTLMTIHAAKGLEFPIVFMPSVEMGTMPSTNALNSGDLEEERRIFYVGMTRAMEKLFMSFCDFKFRFNKNQHCTPSKFLFETKKKVYA